MNDTGINYAELAWGNVVVKKGDKFYYMGMEAADDEVDCYLKEDGATLIDADDMNEFQKWMMQK